jgi:hypothetical protein
VTSDDAVQNTTRIDCACCEIQKGWVEVREARTSERLMEDSRTALHSQNDGCVQDCMWTARVYSGSNLDRRRRHHHHHHCSALGVREVVGHFRQILQTPSSGDRDLPAATEGTWGDTTANFLQVVKHDVRPDLREKKQVQCEWRLDMAQR